MATIVHFEIPADDVGRAQNFYGNLFGWTFEKDPQSDYWMFRTTNGKGEPVSGGGLYKRQNPQQPILDYIDVPSVADFTGKIKDLGGKVLVNKTPVPNMGYFAVCQDTENNAFAIWEMNKNAQ
jgi:predicted enzyme related to lactoylglutathione lyase